MPEITYYLDGDIEAVRSRLSDLARSGRVDIDPSAMFTNVNVAIDTQTELIGQAELERILGEPLLVEDDLDLAPEFSFLSTYRRVS